MYLSARMQAVQSPIIPVVAKLISENPGTISLGQGVVNYGPPQSTYDELNRIQSDEDIHKYGPTDGVEELKNLIILKLESENNISIDDKKRIIITAGSNMAFLNALFVITDPGDEVILTVPYYFNHEMAITMLSCVPVLVPVKNDYQIDTNAIESAITNKTRAIVTISPNNPTGAVYSSTDLKKINALCKNNNIYHISDEAYEYFTYGNSTHYSPACEEDTSEHTISLFSLSKSYGFANWRIGYMVIPLKIHDEILKVQDTNLICPDITAQYGAIGALKSGADYCKNKLNSLNKIREILLENFSCIKDICRVPATEGAFYLMASINTEQDDLNIVKTLICEHKVAVLPGSAFGITEGCYFRIAYGALDEKNALTGIKRITHGLKSII